MSLTKLCKWKLYFYSYYIMMYLKYYSAYCSFLCNYDSEDIYVIHAAYFWVEVVYSVFLVILYIFMLIYVKVYLTVFQPKYMRSRKWKFDLLNREIWDHFAVCFVIIALWEVLEEWICPLNQLSSEGQAVAGGNWLTRMVSCQHLPPALL